VSKRARLHRKIGLSVAVFLGLFVCSGILLHHTETLKLDSNYVNSALILDYYGFDQVPSAQSIRAFSFNGTNTLVQFDEHVYLDKKLIFDFHGSSDKVLAAVDLLPYTVFATRQQVYVFDKSGELFDVLDTPLPVVNIALADGKLIILQSDASYSRLNDNMLDWESIPSASSAGRGAPILWSRPLEIPPEQLTTLWNLHRKTLLSWSRVLQDVHSGRIGGWIGNLIADVAAIALLVLAISGLTMGKRERPGDCQSNKA